MYRKRASELTDRTAVMKTARTTIYISNEALLRIAMYICFESGRASSQARSPNFETHMQQCPWFSMRRLSCGLLEEISPETPRQPYYLALLRGVWVHGAQTTKMAIKAGGERIRCCYAAMCPLAYNTCVLGHMVR